MILKQLIKKTNYPLLLPFYHLVSNEAPLYVKHLYQPKTIAQFKADLDVFLQYYQPISLAEVVAITHGKKKLTKPAFHLTFDDGLANFYEEIAPILIEKNISATLFLNTAFVDNKDLFYRYKSSLLLDNYLGASEKIKEIYVDFIREKGKEESNERDKVVTGYLLGINFKDKELLNQLATKVNFSFNDFLATAKPYLSLDQIKDLQKKGFTFGAHSVDHPLYANLSLSVQLQQTKDSLSWLKEHVNPKFQSFSFPFHDIGVTAQFFDEISNDVAISFGTSGFKKDAIWFNLHRLDMEKSNINTKIFLINNYFKLILKKPFGKYKVSRK